MKLVANKIIDVELYQSPQDLKLANEILTDINNLIDVTWSVCFSIPKLENTPIDDIKYLINYFNEREIKNPSPPQVKRALKKRRKIFEEFRRDW